MNDLSKYLKKLVPAAIFVQRYSRFMFFIFLAGLCGFLVFQINRFASVSPSDTDVSDKLQTISRPHVDEAALTKIQQLQDQNVQVQKVIQEARDNPFSE